MYLQYQQSRDEREKKSRICLEINAILRYLNFVSRFRIVLILNDILGVGEA